MPNEAQQQYLSDNPKLKTFRGNREIILKARQMGFTTFIDALMFLDTMNVPNTQSIIVAQDEINAKRIFQIVHRYYQNLPPHLKRKADTEAKGEITWNSIGSSFFVGWAGSKRLGRGGTINNIHFSEAAFYENAGELIAGLGSSVPSDGNIFLESTANGIGNYFWKEYKAAENSESLFKARFYPWTLDSSYRANSLVLGGEFIITEEEELLQEKYNLTIPQLIWRRNKILELRNAQVSGDSTLGLFPQEFPICADEAFLSTGANFFDVEYINTHLVHKTTKGNEIEIPRGNLILKSINGHGLNRIEIWKRPIPGHRYIITGDPSEGLDQDGSSDSCSADIVDYETWEQVGHIHGKWEPKDFAEILAEAGRWFNDALIVVERNNHGHSVLNTLINVCMYPSQKNGQVSGVYMHQDYDSKSKIRKPGWPTNVKTKAQALNALNQISSDGSLIINCKQTLEEMKLFNKLPGGKFGCLIGHDDRVISLSLAAVLLVDGKFTRKVERKSENRVKSVNAIGRRKGGFI